MKPTLLITLLLLTGGFTSAKANEPIQPKHDGKHFFIRPAGYIPVDPTVGEIDQAINQATAEGRVVNVVSGGLDIPAAMKQVASLPVTFRSTIDGWNYDVTVLKMDFTATGSKLTVGCKFTLQDDPNGTAIYFAGTNIAASGKNGFKGEMNILATTLSNARNTELTPDDLALLNGKTTFHEFPLPHFNNNLWMGLDKDSKVSFSCGAFEKFDLSGFVKSYNTVEQEDLSGANTNTGKPLVLAFSATEVRDWQDMYFPVQTANGFHAGNYNDIGFHFATDARIFLDFSKRQNPPNLQSCASTAGNYWQGIYFDKFDVRLPNFFKMTNGGAVPLGKGSNLFIDNNGLIGDMVADKVFAMSEGYAESGQQNYPISLDKITANFTCGGKVNARMSGDLQLPTCGSNTDDPILIGYAFAYDERSGYNYLLENGENNRRLGSNVLSLSTGSSLTFNLIDGQLNIVGTYPTVPTITSNSYNNSICAGFESTLTVANCNDNVEWSNGISTVSNVVSPIVNSTYSVRCFDKYCIGGESNPIDITVYNGMPIPELEISTTDRTICANRKENVKILNNCVGLIEWKTPENTAWHSIVGDGKNVDVYYPDVAVITSKEYSTRCRLNDCTSEISEVSFNILPAPAAMTLVKSPVSTIHWGTVTLTPSKCDGTLHWFDENNNENLSLLNARTWSRSTDGINSFYVACENTASGCFSEKSVTQRVEVNKCNVNIGWSGESPKIDCEGRTITILTHNGSDNAIPIEFRLDGGRWQTSNAGDSPKFNITDITDCKEYKIDARIQGCEREITTTADIGSCLGCNGTLSWNTGGVWPATDCSAGTITVVTHHSTNNNAPIEFSVDAGPWTTANADGKNKHVITGVTNCRDYKVQARVKASPSKITEITTINAGSCLGCDGTLSWNGGTTWPAVNCSAKTITVVTHHSLNNGLPIEFSVDGGAWTTANEGGKNKHIISGIDGCRDYTVQARVKANPSKMTEVLTVNAGSCFGCEGTLSWNTGEEWPAIDCAAGTITVVTHHSTNNNAPVEFSVNGGSWITANQDGKNKHTISSASDCSDYTVQARVKASPSKMTNVFTVSNKSCAGCNVNKDPIWVSLNTYRCVNNVSYLEEQDTNPNSDSHNDVRTIKTGGSACDCVKPSSPIVYANPANIDSGQSSNLTASGCEGGTTAWSNSAGTGSSVSVSPTSTTTYTATCTKNGCTSDASGGVTVTVGSAPPTCTTPTSLAASPNSITSGGESSLTATCASGAVEWYSDEALNSKLSSTTVKPTSTTKYYAICVNGTCKSSSANVTVNVGCSTPAKPTVSANSTTISCGSSVILTASGCSGTITWSDGSTNSTLTTTLTTTTDFTANCQVNGCTSANAEIKITVNPISAPTISSNKARINSGEQVTLSTTDCSGGTVTWNNSAGTGFSVNLSPTSTTTYTATCTENGCVSGNSGGVTVTVVDQGCTPPAAPTVSVDRTTVSKIGNAFPRVRLTASGCSKTVKWSNGGEGAVINPAISATTTFSATCGSNDCFSASSNLINITLQEESGCDEIPSIPFITTDNVIVCSSKPAKLTASNCNGEVVWFSNWEGSISPIRTGSSIYVNPISRTTYTAKCKVCDDNLGGKSNSVTIYLTSDIKPEISTDRYSISHNDKASLTATQCPNGTVYNWGGAIEGSSITVQYQNTYSTRYSVRCKSQNGCFSEYANGQDIYNYSKFEYSNESALSKGGISCDEQVEGTVYTHAGEGSDDRSIFNSYNPPSDAKLKNNHWRVFESNEGERFKVKIKSNGDRAEKWIRCN